MRSLGNKGNFFFWTPFILRVATRVLHKLGHMASLQLMQDTLDLALKHCDKSRKVAGSILDGDIGIFHWYNPSGCTMALGLIQPLTEMSTSGISWGGGGGECGRWVWLTAWPPSCSICIKILEPRPSATFWACNRPVQGLLYLYRHWLFVRLRCQVSCLISNGSHIKTFSVIFIPVPDDGFSKSQYM